jgi:hypothetical protein
MVEVLGSVEEFKGYESALGVNGFRLDGIAVDGPDWSRNKKRINRVASDGLDGMDYYAA